MTFMLNEILDEEPLRFIFQMYTVNNDNKLLKRIKFICNLKYGGRNYPQHIQTQFLHSD